MHRGKHQLHQYCDLRTFVPPQEQCSLCSYPLLFSMSVDDQRNWKQHVSEASINYTRGAGTRYRGHLSRTCAIYSPRSCCRNYIQTVFFDPSYGIFRDTFTTQGLAKLPDRHWDTIRKFAEGLSHPFAAASPNPFH